MLKKALKTYKVCLKTIPSFTLEIKEIIFGGLLGDFNLQTFSKGKT